jgi:hypothetical protein
MEGKGKEEEPKHLEPLAERLPVQLTKRSIYGQTNKPDVTPHCYFQAVAIVILPVATAV